jgi:hypothetical protein
MRLPINRIGVFSLRVLGIRYGQLLMLIALLGCGIVWMLAMLLSIRWYMLS